MLGVEYLGRWLTKEVDFIDQGDIFLGSIKRDAHITVLLTGRPTIRVVSHL